MNKFKNKDYPKNIWLKYGVIPIISKKDFFSCANNFNQNIFILSLVKLKYGDCCITVITCGCGPQEEGSTPSSRPLKKRK
jgi:hypothetical protein